MSSLDSMLTSPLFVGTKDDLSATTVM